MSAVSSVNTPGVLVTVMLRLFAVTTSILSTPLPKLAISFRIRPGLEKDGGIDTVGNGRNQNVGGFHRFDKLCLNSLAGRCR